MYRVVPAYAYNTTHETRPDDIQEVLEQTLNEAEQDGFSLVGVIPEWMDWVKTPPPRTHEERRRGPFFVLHRPMRDGEQPALAIFD